MGEDTGQNDRQTDKQTNRQTDTPTDNKGRLELRAQWSRTNQQTQLQIWQLQNFVSLTRR